MDRAAAGVVIVLVLTHQVLCAPTAASPVDNPGQNHTTQQQATCTVAGTEYSHGYQIPRADPCELCLCLDGELFCWWQDCPSASPACRESPAYAACADNTTMQLPAAANYEEDLAATEGTSEAQMVAALMTSEAPPPPPPDNNNSNSSSAPVVVGVSSSTSTTTTSSSNNNNGVGGAVVTNNNVAATEGPATATTPTVCRVMGTEYKIGEVLPRDTGTCLECVCDSEARVTCSPKDCASHDEFHSANNLDMFDVDTF